jgi:hypothetical protein
MKVGWEEHVPEPYELGLETAEPANSTPMPPSPVRGSYVAFSRFKSDTHVACVSPERIMLDKEMVDQSFEGSEGVKGAHVLLMLRREVRWLVRGER